MKETDRFGGTPDGGKEPMMAKRRWVAALAAVATLACVYVIK